MHTSSVPPFQGIPGYFFACCRDARRSAGVGYDHPARELTRHLNDEWPYGVDLDEWMDELDRLYELIRHHDDKAVLAWFVRTYPRCMALVPKRRRSTFLRGVYEMAEQQGIVDGGRTNDAS